MRPLLRSLAVLVLLGALPLLSQESPRERVASSGPEARVKGSAEIPPRAGGIATVHDAGVNAFGHPAKGLSARERRAFAVGNAFFRHNWVTAPASTEGRDGLGPFFNERSCSGCHVRDGRSRPPLGPDDPTSGLLFRIGVPTETGEGPDPVYGGQLQDAALHGIAPEARVVIAYDERRGEYADGTEWTLQVPRYRLEDLAYGALDPNVALGPRVAPILVGLGLLEAIPEEDILAREDPDDADGDGISGRGHRLPTADGGYRLGRFGWKATQPDVRHQTAAAFANDIGITSSLFPDELLSPVQRERVRFVSGGTPELDDHKLGRVAFYCRTLAVPARRAAEDPAVRRGERLFSEIGCASCHVPTWRTGPEPEIAAFADQVIHPYTDLLLHDLGPGLADGTRPGTAEAAEWRTPPLWGIGLVEAVNGHTRFLHDGRARNLEEAVLWHGGEALRSREAYTGSKKADREALIAFLRSL